MLPSRVGAKPCVGFPKEFHKSGSMTLKLCIPITSMKRSDEKAEFGDIFEESSSCERWVFSLPLLPLIAGVWGDCPRGHMGSIMRVLVDPDVQPHTEKLSGKTLVVQKTEWRKVAAAESLTVFPAEHSLWVCWRSWVRKACFGITDDLTSYGQL